MPKQIQIGSDTFQHWFNILNLLVVKEELITKEVQVFEVLEAVDRQVRTGTSEG